MSTPSTVRMPADVDRPDRLLAGLTARQLLTVAAGVAVATTVWLLTAGWLPLPVVGVTAAPIVALTAVFTFGHRDGLTADRLAVAWWRHQRSPHRLIPAPGGIPVQPAGAPLAPIVLPAVGVTDGIIELESGCAIVCRASSLNFGLRTLDEQHALVTTVAAWLNALGGHVQIVVRAERVELGEFIAELHDQLPSLPDPALEQAAAAHAGFLAELAGRRDVLRRSVLLVFTDPAPPPAARDVLARRAEDAQRRLAGAGIRVEALTHAETISMLSHAIHPTAPAPRCTPCDDIVIGHVE
jgi:hypothetical protein